MDGDDTLQGLAGDDLLEGNAGDDSLSGGEGNDTLASGYGFDTLDGGAGDDLLLAGIPRAYGGVRVFIGGEGEDTLSMDRYRMQHLDLGVGTDIEVASFGSGILYGTDESDMLDISGVRDLVTWTYNRFEMAESLYVELYDGDDTFLANQTADRIEGGSGNDSISGGAGYDRIFGDDGDDTLLGGADGDELYGGAGQ